MKKIIYTIVVLLVFASCDNGFEELNVDPTKSSQIEANSKFTAALLRTSGERYEAWRANLIYQSTMMQHFATTAGYWSGDKYSWNKGYAASLFDRYYSGPVKAIEDILYQLRDQGKPEEMIAIARIQRVVIYSRLTDVYGDIPYSEAGKGYLEGILKPKYDAQSAIYADMLKELEESAAALDSGTSEWGGSDIIFSGDQGKWKRYANSMMLRLGLRLIKVDPSGAQNWAAKAISGGVMTSNADIAYIQHTAGPEGINKNGNGEVFSADGNPRMSKTFIDFLQGDPRLPILAARRSDGSTTPADLKGLPNGLDSDLLLEATGEDNTNGYAEPNRSIITGEDAPMFFQTYAEVELMLAECADRWGLAGGDVEGHYNAGVTAAMKYLGLYGAAADISDADIATYLTNNPFDGANALEMIGNQYWAATFLNEYETFANWRRTGYPVLTPTNYPGNETNGTIPRRLTYPTSEQTANAESYAAAEAAQGPDVLTTRVWWDKQ
ncbi:MAG: SusD/RagB family nutrient-binding outer membrane lipoprotein [Lutibacter sp.]|nr:MAG: SusD/RagB family nutrient-binding outer membrane lipoprotein [Lutibacter sp.]